MQNEYNAYVTYDDARYPTLVIQTDNQSVGYSLDPSTLQVQQRVCICAAHTSSECLCGAWDAKPNDYWRSEEFHAGFDGDDSPTDDE
jgi:hypothetical protein